MAIAPESVRVYLIWSVQLYKCGAHPMYFKDTPHFDTLFIYGLRFMDFG